jgi:periplasmic protein TonB
MIQPVHWLCAAALAVALHMGLLGFATSKPDVAMERSAGRSGAVWGLPMEMIADVVDPNMEPTETAEAVEPTEIVDHESRIEPEMPVEPETPVETEVTDPAEDVEALEASESAPIEPETTESMTAQTTTEEPEITEPVQVAAWDGGIAVASTPVEEVEPVEATADVEVATLTPVVSEALEVVAEDATPMPRVRPADVPRVEAPPQPKTVSKPKVVPKKPAPTKAAPKQTATVSKTQSAGRAAPASAPAGEQVGTGGTRQGAGGQQLVSSFAGKVAAHLRRHKRYPKEAAAKRQSGTATVTFSISKSGGVRSARLARSSGNSAFDREVVAMVRRAAPFPPIPPAVGKSAMTFTVPVRFQPR